MKNKKGFTLVELLVVIAIIGILSTIAFISLNRARAKARDSKRVSDVRQVMSALELYYNDQTSPSYPTCSGVCANPGCCAQILTTTQLPATYVAQLPTAPTPADDPPGTTTCSASSGYNNSYRYTAKTSAGADCTAAGQCAGYEIGFCIGGATGTLTPGLHTATQSGITP
jgi:general secretion pathway protein G